MGILYEFEWSKTAATSVLTYKLSKPDRNKKHSDIYLPIFSSILWASVIGRKRKNLRIVALTSFVTYF